MIQLLDFQREASESIAARFKRYLDDRPPVRRRRTVPFYQALAAITGAGKTVVLADAVDRMRSLLPAEPVVLWLSKGRVVVSQTYANLQEGGKYHHIVSAFDVRLLSELRQDELTDARRAILYFATVGTFNQKDKEQGDRLIYRCELDTADMSTWDALKSRTTAAGHRRPLIVVYDEGHNLSDQQTNLLLELEPDAVLVASATMKLPEALAYLISALKDEGWHESDRAGDGTRVERGLTTELPIADVADSGLIKREVILGGYETPMETAISELLAAFNAATAASAAERLDFRPKAIYVSKTNIMEGNALQPDDPKRPFARRQAPPILIWRYLVDQGVPPEEIAVYCSLKFDRNYPPPAEFIHYSGADSDYERFVDGGHRHVIFNLSLQEGWDDPSCYFAYIDKSMGSTVQAEQIIGRALRQPCAKHFGNAILNTAHFYVRVDNKGVFQDLLEQVRRRIGREAAAVKFTSYSAGGPRPRLVAPRQRRTIPKVYRDSSEAHEPIARVITGLHDYRRDQENVRGRGAFARIQQRVGDGTEPALEWVEIDHHNAVSARWVFVRAVMRQFPPALDLVDNGDPKFDARVEIGSPAFEHIEEAATKVVDRYLEHARLRQRTHNPYAIEAQYVDPAKEIKFRRALHEAYSGLNETEREFATALDSLSHTWCRNLPRSGYGIPLLSRGKTRDFYPDFLVWKGNDVFAIDTTGEHLLIEKAARKLLAVEPGPSGGRIFVRLVTKGRWTSQPLAHVENGGWTVWGLRDDRDLSAVHFDDVKSAVKACLKADRR